MPTTQTATACGTLDATFVPAVEQTRRFVEEVLEGVEQFHDVYNVRVDEVENRSRDGFIPFTDGGFDGVGYATMGYAHGSGAVPNVIQPYLDRAIKDADEEWDREHPDATVEMIFADPEPIALEAEGQLVLPAIPDRGYYEHPLRQKYYEHFDGWLSEGGTYFYKVRVLFYDVDNSSNVTGKPEAYFFVGLNTDFEYGRDSIPWLSCYGQKTQQTEWLWERNVALDEITEELVDTMIAEAVTALAGA